MQGSLRSAGFRIRRCAVVVAAAVVASAVLARTHQRLSEERDALLQDLTASRRRQLVEAVAAVQHALDAEAHHLRLASRLLATLEEGAGETVLEAMVQEETWSVVRLYEDGALLWEVADPGVPPSAEPHLDGLGALDCFLGQVAAPIPGKASEVGLAASVAGEAERCRTLVVRMDLRPLLVPLEVLSDATTVHLLGSEGEERLSLPPGPPLVEPLLDQVRARPSGSRVIEQRDGPALVVVWAPVRLPGGARWTVAARVSTAKLEEAEARAMREVLAAGLLMGILLAGLAVYGSISARRDAVLAERLRQAGTVAHLKDRAERIVDSVPAGVATLDAQGNVTSVNRELHTRWPRAGPGSLDTLLEGADDADQRRIRDLVAQALRGETPGAVEGPMRLLGRPGEYAVRAVPVRPSTPDVAALLVLDDETELRTLRTQLVRAEKLATVGELAAGIAHEIGTPLSVVRGRAEYAAHKLPEDHAMQRDLGVIVQQIDTVARIIRGLLDFSSRREIERGPVDLGLLAVGVRDLLATEAHRRGITLRVVPPPSLCVVPGDADQLQQVLVNLALNALDATDPGGTVLVAVEPGADAARVRVTDTGRGIPREILNRVFDPFFTTKRRGQGTGLGLAIVTQLVRDHGGTVAVDSEEGRGTEFVVELPWRVPRG